MYIKKIYDENIGPIEKIAIDFPFEANGNPKPILFVGENGSGKSTLLSNIVDSFYTLANKHYNNAMFGSGDGDGKQYFKTISPIEIRTGSQSLYSYILFNGETKVQYIFKSGTLSVEEFKKRTNHTNNLSFNWKADGNFKEIKLQQDKVSEIFSDNVICYFGPDRYEKPMWMGNKYLNYDDFIHPSMQENWANVLKNPIAIKNVTEVNVQWLLDVITDSRPDVVNKDGKLTIENVHITELDLLRKARNNLEQIMSKIVGKEVCFSLNYRNSGTSRFNIKEKYTNKIIAPTLDSLSTGQIALFNMFSSIVRYADTNDINKSFHLDEIIGIVVIDEIELHLHTKLQKEVLPKLIKLFPKIQFIITTHAPLFLLGMQETFGDGSYEIFEMPTATKIDVERFSEFQRAYEYFKTTATYQRDAEKALQKFNPGTKTLVITEGATDWKHIKTAYSVLKDDPKHSEIFNDLDFDFFEYEPANSKDTAQYKLEMGNKTLTSICENHAKLPHDTKYIFIADCDVPDTNAKLGNSKGKYRKWDNNVYSFIIPIPDSRSSTPNISIEHLYSDEEIKTEVVINGVPRRLYMGNEFDNRGLASSIDRFCERANICGPDKINIIEGTQGDKITSISNTDGVDNYALSKMNFAKYVSENPGNFNFDNFIEIFKIIKEIVIDGEE